MTLIVGRRSGPLHFTRALRCSDPHSSAWDVGENFAAYRSAKYIRHASQSPALVEGR
jgi:hypothetical protein